MPDLIGTIGNQVESILRARGFRVTIIEVPYPAAPPRFVVHQSPQAGYPVALTDTITLEVSR
jgi:beta-lactam-binding protein with PASTA domain